MILVDTNVVSEPLRRAPEPRVAEWRVQGALSRPSGLRDSGTHDDKPL